MMKISVFGNKDYTPDSIPLKIMPKLSAFFPAITFIAQDPNELTLPTEKEWWIIDTVVGLKSVKLIEMDDLKKNLPDQVSMHSFDLGTHLFWISKLDKNLKIHIIGVPPEISEDKAINGVGAILETIQKTQY
ncbi:MAG: hypothetical protein Q8L47_00800 [bacterium]|nr:hypothetical protein [bacterium]